MVNPLPVLGQDPRHRPQDMRGQAGNLYPGQDQKPGVAGDQGEILLPASVSSSR